VHLVRMNMVASVIISSLPGHQVEQPNTGLLVIWSIQYTSRSQPVTLNVAEVSNEKDLPGVSRDMLYTRTPEFMGMARHMETKTKS